MSWTNQTNAASGHRPRGGKRFKQLNYITYPISRAAFRVTALIDWLDVTVCTSTPSQFPHIKRALERAGAGKLYVEPINPAPGGVAHSFTIRVRDTLANDLAALLALLDKLAEDYPIVQEPTISAIEIACDFWHKGPLNVRLCDTLAMTYRLQSSLLGDGTKGRQFDPELGKHGANRFMDRAGARLDPSCNLRIGNKWDAVSWHAYFKCVDNMKPLPEKNWRARVEITLQGDALGENGLYKLADLESYRFDRVAHLFRFRRPIDPEKLAGGDRYKLTAILANRRLHDATPARGMHSFNAIGRRDKWRKLRAESRHLETDRELTKAVRDALNALHVKSGVRKNLRATGHHPAPRSHTAACL